MPDSRPTMNAAVGFGVDATLNVVPAMGKAGSALFHIFSQVLMALTEGGMQYLIAGARANVAMKALGKSFNLFAFEAGRYFYEVKIIEALNPVESTQGIHGRTPQPRLEHKSWHH